MEKEARIKEGKLKYRDKIWLEKQHREKGKDFQEIAEECGVTKATISYWCDKFDIKFRYRDEEWLREQYSVEGRRVSEIANICGVDNRTIYRWIKRFDIKMRERGTVRLECEQCGGSYKVDLNKKDTSRFCSRECFYKWQSENQTAEDNPNWQGGKIELTCEQCGETYKVTPAREKNSRFCSRACLSNWRSENRIGKNSPNWQGGKVRVVCEQCGKVYKVKPYKKDRSEKHFCSGKCLGKWESENRVGEDHPRWSGGYKNDPRWKLRQNVSSQIHYALRKNKADQHWENLVPYNLEDLKQHLEEQFEDSMRWENYGKGGWEIDHIKPVSSFDFTDPEDKEFQKCFALDNLQPLWAEENRRKGNKLNWSH